MKTQTSNALAYSLNMLSFLFLTKDAGNNIQAIYLFGSAVRGELQNKSDLDIFVECQKTDEETVQKTVDAAIVRFMASDDYAKWKQFHFMYPFTVQTGLLAEWDLKSSIASEGLLLYSRTTAISAGRRFVLFIIQYPPQKKNYVSLRRLLFGRDGEEYQDKGLVQELQGQKLSSHIFMLPTEEQSRMIGVLSKANIHFSMKEIQLLES